MEIKTTGDVRRRLISLMSEIEKGEIELDKATSITKVAAQVNESIYAEIKVARLQLDAGKQKSEFGKLKIVEDDSE